ncbi:hypothetical protein WOC76_09070 [Methylocystis sp. IM3]|uniref:hypothetical protein n=1 Tax=unclassified Methylocystis TaxID=2625913 RepID=UPI0030F566B0
MDLVLVVLEITIITVQTFLPHHLHASCESAHDGWSFVIGEIMSHAPAQERHNLPNLVLCVFLAFPVKGRLALHHLR